MNNFSITLPGLKYLDKYLELDNIKRIIVGNNKYSIRMNKDYSLDEIKMIIRRAHDTSKEVYIAFNKIFHEKEIDKIEELLEELISLKPDGIIFSDFGVYETVKEKELEIKLLFNTDTTVTNGSYVELAYELGINEVELAKEITLDDIKEINLSKKTPIQVMVHGHLYMYHSYRKLLDSYSHVSNKKIDSKSDLFLYDEERNLKYPIVQNDSGTHILSAYDLSMISKMDIIYSVGIDYLKLDSFGYEEKEFYNIVKNYTNSYEDFKNKITSEQFRKNNRKRFQNIKLENQDKKYSTGFMFKKSIY